VLVPTPAPAAQGPGLNELVLDWARGRYASPLICEIEGEPVRGLRRVLVTPGPRQVRPPVGSIVFVRMTVDEATRCFTDLGESAPNITGRVQIRLPGTSHHPDTARRDFASRLRRERGFDFDVPAGRLRLQEVGADPGEAREVDFEGGSARLSLVAPGSDAERLLGGLPDVRRLLLELESPDGTTVRLPLALVDER